MTATAESRTVLTQLCHHLSLDKTGKVKGAVENLVLTVLAVDPEVGVGSENEVAVALSTYFSVQLPVGQVREAIETLLRRQDLHRTPDGAIRLSRRVCEEVQQRIADAEQLEATVRREWLLEVAAAHPDLPQDKLWEALQTYCGGVFREHGALAVQLLGPVSEAKSSPGLSQQLEAALRTHGLDSEGPSREALNLFFRGAGTVARTRYVSQLLDGTFTFFALSVSDETADFLREQLPTSRLFLDTNVVLGVLGLNDSPLNEATEELLSFIHRHKLPYQVYYHERTLKELRDVITGASGRLRSRRWTQALSRGVTQWASGGATLSGIERAYHERNAEVPVDPDVWLSKFEHTEELLRDRGIKLFREDANDDDVETKGQYVAEFAHWLNKHRPDRPPRPYSTLDHDIVIWMSLQRIRRRGRNPLKTGAILLTIDHALFEFDREFLRKQDPDRVATSVLPQQLLQVLRPLVGATADFDGRFLEVFAASEFRTAQTDYSEAASMAVSYLATYNDVSPETAVRVLSDEVLLSRLRPGEQTDSEVRELIETAVFQDNTALVAEVEQVRELATQADRDRAEHEQVARRAVAETAAAMEQIAALTAGVSEAEGAAVAAQHDATTRLSALETQLQSEQARRVAAEKDRQMAEATSARRLVLLRLEVALLVASGGILALWLGPGWVGWHAAMTHEHRSGITTLLSASWAGGCWLLVRPGDWRAVLALWSAALITAASLL